MSTPQANSQTLTPQEQIDMAGQVRQAKSGGGEESEAQEEQGADQPKSLREKVMAARRAMDIKQRAKDKIQEKVVAPVKTGTNNALRWAWMTLIPSFGLSLIYINLHVFLKMVFGEKLFCKLGDEWIPKPIKDAGGDAGKMGGKAIGIVEVMGLLMLDLAVFFIVFAVLAILVWIADNIVLQGMIWVWNLIN